MSMEKLKMVIGPAPSELPYDILVGNLMKERERINKVLFSPKAVKKTIAKAKTVKKPRVKKTLTRDQAADILRRLTL